MTAPKPSIQPRPQQPQAHQPPRKSAQKDKKLLNVTVTVLSLNGLHAKETAGNGGGALSFLSGKNAGRGRSRSRTRTPSLGRSPSRGRSVSLRRTNNSFRRSRSKGNSKSGKSKSGKSVKVQPAAQKADAEKKPVEGVATTVVASFRRVVATGDGASKEKVTNLASLPLTLPPGDSTFQDVVRWPDETRLSCFTFRRHFSKEEGAEEGKAGTPRYVPQLCPVRIAVSRDGVLNDLGTADIYVGGEERGNVNVNIPIASTKESKSNSRKRGGGGRSKNGGVHMTKVKGDTLRCGLADKATLRVLVHVWDPAGGAPTRSIRKALSFQGDKALSANKGDCGDGFFLDHLICCNG